MDNQSYSYLDGTLEVISRYKREEPLRNVTLVPGTSCSYLQTWAVERYDFQGWRSWMGRNWYYSLYVSAIYVGLLFLGQRWMRNRAPYDLKNPSIVWNIVMGIFCFTGFYRALPEVVAVLMGPDGVHRSLCIFENHSSTAAFWGLLNVLSRVAELLGTAFIILKKRPLIFLHWYHHVTVLIYCWYFYEAYEISLRVFGILNSFVHALVYFYFALKGLGVKLPRKLAMGLTLVQLSEMFIGIAVNIYNLRAKNAGIECHRQYYSIYCAFTMYATYFVLFAKLFKDAYLTKRSKAKKAD